MRLVKLSTLFDIRYGNQFDINKMEVNTFNADINFVSRSSKNMWIVAKVEKYNNIKPFGAWLITVTLWGSYLLSSFVQQKPFYTAQNIKVLSPKNKMTDIEKLYYCFCIKSNRFKYTSHWREANKTLNDLLVPESIPDDWKNIDVKWPNSKAILDKNIDLNIEKWKYFKYEEIFVIDRWKSNEEDNTQNKTLLIGASQNENGSNNEYIISKPYYKKPLITVWNWGNTGCWQTFFQSIPFNAKSTVNVLDLLPKFDFWLNKYIWMFLITIIKLEKYRFNFWRGWSKDRMEKDRIKLPINKNWHPDFEFMENYIKSLPYSANL